MNKYKKNKPFSGITRQNTSIYLRYAGIDVKNFTFKINENIAHIYHSGYIEVGKNGSAFIGDIIKFLEKYTSRKRKTIVNNLRKCLNIPEGDIQ